MKNDNIISFKIPYDTEAWHEFRTIGISPEKAEQLGVKPYEGGIGASEIGKILGLNDYPPPVQQIYHFKVGTEIPKRMDNEKMKMGRILEPVVKNIWSCWDTEGWVERHNKWEETTNRKEKDDLLYRKARAVNSYLVNKKYPYLFASLDYYAQNGTLNLITHEPEINGFPLEIKTINGNYARMWESEIPQYHIAQVYVQMMITESKYSEIAVLIDGQRFKCFALQLKDDQCDLILKYAENFWRKVIEGRKAKNERDKFLEKNRMTDAEKCQAMIDSLEPDPGKSKAAEKYMKERYTKEIESIKGGLKELNYCKRDDILKSVEKMIDSERQKQRNYMINFMRKNQVGVVDMSPFGKAEMRENKNGVFSLYHNLTDKPNVKVIETNFEEFLSKAYNN